MVKKLDDVIKLAFEKAGFTEKEVMDGCWLLERNEKAIAWIALHKFLERVAQRMGIVFEDPEVMNCTENEVAILVRGAVLSKNNKELTQAWSIGEASPKNCTNAYRWAMAEKRAKDRVILKLLGIAGDMYSEEEADEFKEKTPAQKAAETRAQNKADKEEAIQKYEKCIDYLKNTPEPSQEVLNRAEGIVSRLNLLGLYDQAKDLTGRIASYDQIPY